MIISPRPFVSEMAIPSTRPRVEEKASRLSQIRHAGEASTVETQASVAVCNVLFVLPRSVPSRDPQGDIDLGRLAFLELADGSAPEHDPHAIAKPDRFLDLR